MGRRGLTALVGSGGSRLFGGSILLAGAEIKRTV